VWYSVNPWSESCSFVRRVTSFRNSSSFESQRLVEYSKSLSESGFPSFYERLKENDLCNKISWRFLVQYIIRASINQVTCLLTSRGLEWQPLQFEKLFNAWDTCAHTYRSVNDEALDFLRLTPIALTHEQSPNMQLIIRTSFACCQLWLANHRVKIVPRHNNEPRIVHCTLLPLSPLWNKFSAAGSQGIASRNHVLCSYSRYCRHAPFLV
jgi:hypothetical protein